MASRKVLPSHWPQRLEKEGGGREGKQMGGRNGRGAEVSGVLVSPEDPGSYVPTLFSLSPRS